MSEGSSPWERHCWAGATTDQGLCQEMEKGRHWGSSGFGRSQAGTGRAVPLQAEAGWGSSTLRLTLLTSSCRSSSTGAHHGPKQIFACTKWLEGEQREHQQHGSIAALGRGGHSPPGPGHESPHPVEEKADAHRGSLLTGSSFLLSLHPEWVQTTHNACLATLDSEPVDTERRWCAGHQWQDMRPSTLRWQVTFPTLAWVTAGHVPLLLMATKCLVWDDMVAFYPSSCKSFSYPNLMCTGLP